MRTDAPRAPAPATERAPVATAGLRIGIDALSLRRGLNGGGEMYIRSLVEGLGRVDPESSYFVFATRRSAALFRDLPPNFRVVVCPVPGGRAELWVRLAWEMAALRLQARALRLDVVHFPANLVPPAFPVPTVLTTHDFSSLFYRAHLPGGWTFPLQRLLDRERVRACHRAERVLAISRFTAGEIATYAPEAVPRVRVVLSAGREQVVPSREEAGEIVARFGVRRPYVLTVATLYPHKNVPRLLQAFARVADGALAGHDLVLVGRQHAQGLRDEAAALGIAERVVFTGYVPDEDIAAFYRAAEFFVLPSLYEGFGLPVLEAGACGTAVAAARAGSLPEVGGDAAAYFDPLDVADIAAVLARLASDPALRREAAERARANTASFSWTRTARETLAAYREAAGRRAAP
jgi:glycosyltransferase involved in cell wall biosynthesis